MSLDLTMQETLSLVGYIAPRVLATLGADVTIAPRPMTPIRNCNTSNHCDAEAPSASTG